MTKSTTLYSVVAVSREPDLGLIATSEDDRDLFNQEILLRGREHAFTEMKGIVLVFVALLAVASATQVNHCGSGEKFSDPNQVKITGCDVPPCKLKRRTKAGVEEKFTPDEDVETLMNSVNAAVLGVPLPFVGVDGTSACENVYNLEGTPVGCPLKKDTEYVYKREFPVLQIYPTISMVIHYALMQGNHTIACFEVPAKITN